MTSNQIANRTNIESERHNVVVEEETERHNKATENIQAAANEENRRYHDTSTKLQKEYNEALLAYYNASLEHKKEYENKLAEIQEQRNSLEASHNSTMEALGAWQAETDQNYKTAIAWKGLYDSSLEAKRLYYEGQKTEAYVTSIGNMHIENMKRIQNESAKLQHEKTMDMINQNRLDTQIRVLEEQLAFSQRKWEEAEKLGVRSRAFKDIVDSVTSITRETVQAISNVSKAYAGAEALATAVSGL